MFGDEFLTYANTAFAGGKNVYFAADIAATGNGYLAVDINGNGAFNAGVDTYIELTGLLPLMIYRHQMSFQFECQKVIREQISQFDLFPRSFGCLIWKMDQAAKSEDPIWQTSL